MILYDPSVTINYRDYGIMIPVPPDREKKILEFLGSEISTLDFAGASACLGKQGPPLNREDLERIHCKNYIRQLYGQGLKPALLNTFELLDAEGRPSRYEPDRAKKPLQNLFQTLFAQAGGTYLACLLALEKTQYGFCFYLGGGMHHARYDAGCGFCLINDAAAAAFKIIAEKHVSLIWIIDMDAHKGDGTAELIHFARERGELQKPAEIFEQAEFTNRKPSILTFSIHMAKGWPLDRESIASAKEGRSPLLSSDIDIGINEGEEAEYTTRLAEGISKLESLSMQKPDLVLVVDGADTYEHDSLPSSSLLRLTLEQCLERDIFVYRYLTDRGIPSAWLQSGGYGERAWEPPAHFLRSIL